MNLLLISLQKNGAAPRDALEFSNALSELHAKHTIVIAADNELKEEYTHNKYRTVRIIKTFSSSPLSFIFWSITLIRPLRLFSVIWSAARGHTSGVTILSTHFHPWLEIISCAKPLLRFRWYHAVHEDPFGDKERRSTLSKHLERGYIKHADAIVCHSEFVKQELAKHIKTKPMLVLPLGAYVSAARGVTPHPAFAHKRRPLIACIGRLEPYKGLDDLLVAFAILKKDLPADLLIAGRGNFSDAFRAELVEQKVIVENRWLTPRETSQYLAACDVLVLPYKGGSQSGMISLALALGKPVIATRVGGLPEQVDENQTGLLVPPADPKALAMAMRTLLDNPMLLERMGMNARVLGSGRLSWKRSAEIFLAELQK